ncbi:MAG: glycosyltransferase family 87 protein [Actinomycetota bacterium]
MATSAQTKPSARSPRTQWRRLSEVEVSPRVVGVLLVLGVAGLLVAAWFVHQPTGFRPWLFENRYDNVFDDLLARREQILTLKATGNIYEPFAAQAFTYPPGAIFAFYWTTWIGISAVPLTWTLLSLGSMTVAFAMVLRTFNRLKISLALALGCWLTLLTLAIYPPFAEGIEFGQLAPTILALVLLDELVVRGKMRGVAIGIASAIKLYPLVFVVAWALRRQWRDVVTALGTFFGLTALASLMWPKSAQSFFVDLLWNGEDFKHMSDNVATFVASQSISAMLTRPPVSLSPHGQLPAYLVAGIVALIAIYGAHHLWLRGARLSSAVVLLTASSVCSPVAWDHYFSYAPLVWWVAVEAGSRSRLRVASIVAGVVWLVPWNFFRREPSTTPWVAFYEFISRNAIGFAAVAIILAAGLDAWHPRRAEVLDQEPSIAA